MKLAYWKTFGLAGFLTLGYAVLAEGAQIKVDEDVWADFGLKMKVSYKRLDKRVEEKPTVEGLTGGALFWMRGEEAQNVFEVEQARIYFEGQVLPWVQFYGSLDGGVETF